MFDLPELLNRASDMFKGSGFEDLVGADVTERLTELGTSEYGLDAAQLGYLQSTLEGAGVNSSALPEDQLCELLASVKENGGPEGVDPLQVFEKASG